jgi:hypothetical protein
MFGRAIYDHTTGNYDQIRRLLTRKQRAIARYRSSFYLESSHSFLKSYYDLALEFFPNSKFIHLIRNPLKVVRSIVNRTTRIHQLRLPWVYYHAGDGGRYYRWSLTGLEPIYKGFNVERLSLFERNVIQWIEIENRAISFLRDSGKEGDCITMETPSTLNDKTHVGAMFRFLGVSTRHAEIRMPTQKHATLFTPTVETEEDQFIFRKIVEELPPHYLEIFTQPPYTNFKWAELLLP